MQIPHDAKPGLLMDALKERYSSIHKIRDRVQSTGIWALGILFAAAGWLLQNDPLHGIEKLLALIIIGLGFSVVRFKYLTDLRRGFQGQQKAAAKIEEALGFYEPDFYLKGESLYDSTWRHSGTKKGAGKFFETTYLLLYVGLAFLVVAVLFSGVFVSGRGNNERHIESITSSSYESCTPVGDGKIYSP